MQVEEVRYSIKRFLENNGYNYNSYVAYNMGNKIGFEVILKESIITIKIIKRKGDYILELQNLVMVENNYKQAICSEFPFNFISYTKSQLYNTFSQYFSSFVESL